ncbi:hypothetical protein CVT24_004772 [Panaeolus cyanescens]|uniref:BAH domain-containing protein n=1 Tax=Panaeolus cyanescens TaxID=181874 RepID=A0A409V9U7_9AGAR|nr:hypothetical protein CVT24_004772 [Panaeolus cyanescens]
MALTQEQKTAVEEVLDAILSATSSRGRRQLVSMFMDPIDREEWPQYYEVIPEPRCIKTIQSNLEKGKYKNASEVWTDLSLVFWNALFYNEPKSQISLDAEHLKTLLEAEWKKRSVLPDVRSSPPPSSAQKLHGVASEETREEASTLAPAPTSTPAPIPSKAKAKTVTPNPATPSALPAMSTITTTGVTPLRTTQLASGSTSAQPQIKPPVSIRPKSIQRQSSPEIEVDVVSPDSDGQEDDSTSHRNERDPYSEEIVKQLEKGLPRWPGFSEEGWTTELHPERYSDIVHVIKSYKDIVGNRLGAALEAVPEESSTVVSLKVVETRARHKMYKSSKEFDMDMARIFERARRWHEPGTESYGRCLLLQRLYQALTSSNPPAAPYVSSTNFAALRAGPGNVKPVHGSDTEGVPNVTTHRVLTRDRTFVDELNYKGWNIRLADWVHLSNPDDPSRPIIGQVFRCWVSEEPERKGQKGITVSWYYRPEQTFHPSTRQFWEGEIFKTSHFAEHPLEDIIEKIACQFTARHIRGRPRPPYWYVGFPLYVCDSRYNDRERSFVTIKNWNSCIPEEVRQKAEYMPIFPFEKTVYPVLHPSPFISKVPGKPPIKGPGGLKNDPPETAGDGDTSKKQRKHENGPTRGAAPGTPSYYNHTVYAQPVTAGYGYQQQAVYNPAVQPFTARPSGPDRSIVSAAGGLAVIGGAGQVEKLPPETAKLFDRDPETNQVLWFSAPPMNVARPRGAQYSLTYLHFLAQKRKRQEASDSNSVKHNEDMGVGDGSDGHPDKRPRTTVVPTVTETMQKLWQELDMDAIMH